MKLNVDESIKQVPYYPKAAMYGLGEGWVRLSSNENSFPPSQQALSAVLDAALYMNRYPGGETELKTAVADKYSVGSDQVVIGNGSNELIEMALKAMKRPEKSAVIISEPSFAFYNIAAAIYGYDVVRVPLEKMKTNLDTILRAVDSDTRVIFLNNPNNPAGTIFEEKPFERFLRELPRDILVAVDEAYAEFAESKRFPRTLSYVNDFPVVMLRTFSKAYGLAGLRVGYGIGEAGLISYLERTKQPFSVNMLALAAAQAALGDVPYLDKVLKNNKAEKRSLYETLKEMGVEFVPTEANFILMHLGPESEAISRKLFGERILIRWMKAYGLPDWVRVTIGKPEENRRFIEALKGLIR